MTASGHREILWSKEWEQKEQAKVDEKLDARNDVCVPKFATARSNQSKIDFVVHESLFCSGLFAALYKKCGAGFLPAILI